ncbi:putative amino acid permease [Salmonella enterica subsp. enterica serovar Inverness str. R8-3668]|uniref:Putative amino acid permease n=1 Tax=Salmonella enterica subsp. enterica serovar Inverness str. R8-3668 TaxID=913075 RepID=G5NDL7_SALET|nr:putative amino acid permease [Salmonella enterica subsp. enterica serovar Inverness str. R8-3668]
MKKVKKLSLTDLVLYGLVFMVPIAPVSLYGVVYNLSHGMVALVYIIGAGMVALVYIIGRDRDVFYRVQLLYLIAAYLLVGFGLCVCWRMH